MEKIYIFSNEDAYDDIIKKWIDIYKKQYGVEVGVHNVKGIIAQESMFNPGVKRWEANVRDYAWGLMQILGRTAELMGWDGKEDLLNPEINLKYGIKYFVIQFQKYKKYTDAYAAYNAGSVKRDEYGRYINQSYVDMVSAFATFYYYRDVKKDVEMAKLYRERIREMRKRMREAERGEKEKENREWVLIVLIALVILVVIMITKGSNK